MGGWAKLISLMFKGALARAQSKGAMALMGTAAAVDFLNLDFFRQVGIQSAPGSEGAAIEEVSRTVMRVLNLSGDEVLWPRHGQRHAMAGEPIVPGYMVIDFGRGRAWMSGRYVSQRSVRAARRRGSAGGFRRGQNLGLRQSQAYARG